MKYPYSYHKISLQIISELGVACHYSKVIISIVTKNELKTANMPIVIEEDEHGWIDLITFDRHSSFWQKSFFLDFERLFYCLEKLKKISWYEGRAGARDYGLKA